MFSFQLTERILIFFLRLDQKIAKKLVPPLYMYKHPTVREARRDGISYKLDISKYIDHCIFFLKVNDPAYENAFHLIKKDAVVFDIGANIGALTLDFARRCHDGVVYSFEPDTENFSSLRQNIALNTFTNIHIFNLALGNYNGKSSLYKINASNPGTNRIYLKPPDNFKKLEDVQVITLDRFVNEYHIERIDFIKIDVEGFEFLVLKGGEMTVRKFMPILFIEVIDANLREQSQSAAMLLNYIKSLGYDIKNAQKDEDINVDQPNLYADVICTPSLIY